jgi:hypothetical protein
VRKLGTFLVAGAFGLIGAFALVSPASAATVSDTKTVSVQIVDRPDSGHGGTWAIDTFKRNLTIVGESLPQLKTVEETPQPVSTECAVILENNIQWTYTVTGKDEGTFKTTSLNKSPQHEAPLKANLVGNFSGDFKFSFEAPAAFCSYTAPQATVNDAPSTSEFVLGLFKDSKMGEHKFTNWKWKYELCNEYWINADPSRGGNKRDITGFSRTPCKEVVFKDTCEGVTVTLKNNAPSDLSVATFRIGETVYPVKGGESTEVKVANPTEEIKVYAKFGRNFIKVAKHTWVKPNCETPTTPPATVPPTVPPVDNGGGAGGLPVTGPQAALIGGIGTLVVVAGIALFVVARKRRVVTALPE